MRVLLIKTSSMGDIIHTLPALTDAKRAIPNLTVDWVVEEAFSEIPHWHPAVNQVIPIAFREWRKQFFARTTRDAIRKCYRQLHTNHYDIILDAQGLAKSAWLTFLAKGKRAGLDFRSARESIASFAYQEKHTVNFYQHAVLRMRLLVSLALGYPMPTGEPDFGLDVTTFNVTDDQKPFLVFLHGTTWKTKEWPESYWAQLGKIATDAGFHVKIGGASADEIARAKRIANENPAMNVVPRLTIAEMATLLANAHGAIAVDTGFGHLAAALGIPTLSIYGATNPNYTSAIGPRSRHLTSTFPCAPCLSRTCTFKGVPNVSPACYQALTPNMVWAELMGVMRMI